MRTVDRLPALLILTLLGGCSTPERIIPLVVPEQRTLEIRAPAEIIRAHLPTVPPPATVSQPAPLGAPAQLSLDETIRIALVNSKVIRLLAGTTAVSSGKTIYDPAITNTSIDVARGEFDPVLTAKNAFNRTELPSAFFDPLSPHGASITGTRIDNYELGLGISKKLVTGAKLSLDTALTTDRFTPGPAPLNPQERATTTLSLTQPLLQGAGVGANIAPILLARINTERSYFQLKDAVQTLVRDAIEAYWQVVFARTDVWARKQQVEQGTFAFELADARWKNGLGTEGEAAQARLALANFRATLVIAEANLLQREAALRNLLGLPPTVPERLVPTTPPTPERLQPSWAEVVSLAGEMRPDLIELSLVLEADQQKILVARNQALPKVDAALFYRWNGLDGETPNGTRLATGAGQFTDWTVGVNFSVPLGLRAERANVRNAELVLASDRANLEQAQHAALHTLAANLRNLSQYYEQYLAFRDARTAARRNLEQQIAAFRVRKTIFLNVLQAITDWGNAISSEAQSLAFYNIELASLERETGTILETHGVRFMEERYGSLGPLGRLAHPRLYPQSVAPGPNAARYPDKGEPADKALDKERPSFRELLPSPPKEPVPPESRRAPEEAPLELRLTLPRR